MTAKARMYKVLEEQGLNLKNNPKYTLKMLQDLNNQITIRDAEVRKNIDSIEDTFDKMRIKEDRMKNMITSLLDNKRELESHITTLEKSNNQRSLQKSNLTNEKLKAELKNLYSEYRTFRKVSRGKKPPAYEHPPPYEEL